MPAAEQRERMASLRSTVREFNVFRWAGRMLADAGPLARCASASRRASSATGAMTSARCDTCFAP